MATADLNTFNRKKVSVPHIDLIPWLAQQTLYPKVYWKDRDRSTVRAAIGSVCQFSHIPPLESNWTLYGGMRFDPEGKTDPCWDGFGNANFWIPQIELVQDECKTEMFVYKSGAESQLQTESEFDLPELNLIKERTDIPPFPQWKVIIDEILNAISHEQVEKVVAARKTILEFEKELSPWPLIEALKGKAARATLFAFELAPHLCFFGATPEKLFDRRGRALESDAVAGTRRRGADLAEDRKIGQELLKNPKDLREFLIVKRTLETLLSGFARDLVWDGPNRILKNAHVQHIYNRLKIQLKGNATDAELIECLHPTPALGGSPRGLAMDLLRKIEPFDRGWYGGPVGILQADSASFAVAIRSGLIKDRQLHLFAGTGIVQESSPDLEWEELEQKISPITSSIR